MGVIGKAPKDSVDDRLAIDREREGAPHGRRPEERIALVEPDVVVLGNADVLDPEFRVRLEPPEVCRLERC